MQISSYNCESGKMRVESEKRYDELMGDGIGIHGKEGNRKSKEGNSYCRKIQIANKNE